MIRRLSLFVAAGWCVAVLAGCQPAETIAPTAAETEPIAVGKPAPDATLRRVDGSSFSLAEELTGKRTVLVFYRGGWCPFCTRHLAGLQEAQPELAKLGYRILAVSPDRPAKLAESIGKTKLTYDLAADGDLDAARAFGLAFHIPDETVTLYKDRYKIDLEDASGRTHHALPVPGVFLVDPTSQIVYAHTNPDYKTRLSTEALLKAARNAK